MGVERRGLSGVESGTVGKRHSFLLKEPKLRLFAAGRSFCISEQPDRQISGRCDLYRHAAGCRACKKGAAGRERGDRRGNPGGSASPLWTTTVWWTAIRANTACRGITNAITAGMCRRFTRKPPPSGRCTITTKPDTKGKMTRAGCSSGPGTVISGGRVRRRGGRPGASPWPGAGRPGNFSSLPRRCGSRIWR